MLRGHLLVWLGAGSLLCSCNGVLGIEELHEGPAPGTEDSGTSQPDGATADGSSHTDASTDASTDATASQDSASDAFPADTGSMPDASNDVATEAVSDTVQGKVIDFWRHPVANVAVSLGATNVVTDQNGAFTVAGVTATYDVALTISTSVYNTSATFGWVFQGLTRRDPTLQVYRGLPTRSGEIHVDVSNVTFPLDSSHKIWMAFAGPDGQFDTGLDVAMTDSGSPGWTGPATTQGTAHALLWAFTGGQLLPTSFVAHDAHPVALDENNPGSVAFDLTAPDPPIPSGSLTGSVTTGAFSDSRENDVYVRFADGAHISIVQDTAPQSSFTYVVPTIDSAGITFAAAAGDASYLPYAVAYKDDLVAGQAIGTLDIPVPQALIGPVSDATGVDKNTQFQWSGTAGVAILSVLSVPTYDGVFVVTAQKQAKLPSFTATSFSLPANTQFSWAVETHGTLSSVDDAAGPNGFIDEFNDGTPRGPRHGTGSFTSSEARGFTTAVQ